VLFTVLEPDLEELVGDALADLGPPDDLLELLVQRLVAATPVNVGFDRGEEEREEWVQVLVKRVLPRRIEVIG
jgi:hypothetical protein